jgi:polyisoprenoid-binding protein YceI
MRKLGLFLLILPACVLANSAEQDTVRFNILPESEAYYTAPIRIALVSTSTVTGRNNNVSGSVMWIATDGRAKVEASVRVDAATFESGNATRDRDVRTMLEAESYPEIVFRLESILGLDETPLTSLDGTYVAVGMLTVRGITKEISVPVEIHYRDGQLTVAGSTASKYTDFGIDPPRVAGFIGRAPDKLRLHIRLIGERN